MIKLTHTVSPKKKKRSHRIDHLNHELLLQHRKLGFQWKQKNMQLDLMLKACKKNLKNYRKISTYYSGSFRLSLLQVSQLSESHRSNIRFLWRERYQCLLSSCMDHSEEQVLQKKLKIPVHSSRKGKKKGRGNGDT